MAYEHLRLEKESPVTDRHRRPGFGPPPPADPRGHGNALLQSFRAVRAVAANEDLGGFDDRKLLKIRLREGERQLPDFNLIEGLEVVSQEGHEVVLAFATATGLNLVEERLATLARDGRVTRKELLFVIDAFEHWTPEDRTGAALAEQGLPEEGPCTLDVELWPQEMPRRRQSTMDAFVAFAAELRAEVLDRIESPSLLMVRLRCSREAVEQVLRYRDARTVDLPPRWGLAIGTITADVNRFPPPGPPPAEAPRVAVLDAGLVTGQPLIAPAVGHAQGYVLPDRSPDDSEPWHGTAVAGLALYGDVEAAIAAGAFTPNLHLVSGRVFNHDGADQTEFVENAVERAVRDLNDGFGCRVFNLSYGDLNKVYTGGHVRGLAYTLDRLTRELGVLFVVATGNLKEETLPGDPVGSFPGYLLEEGARLVDPATALNVVTVGGIARHEATRDAQRYPQAIEARPIARTGHPFPLTRSGPSIGGAIKPDFVEHAGNLAAMRLAGRTDHRGLGVVTTNGGFASGHVFREEVGTSFAAPTVAHRAAKLLRSVPDASHNLLRALLGAHADWPAPSVPLLNPNNNSEGREILTRLVGYGCINDSALEQSLDNVVSLICEEQIGNDRCQFYAVPIPDELWDGGRRTREVTVALAYSPVVRTTRLDYRMTKLKFNLVVAADLDAVAAAFQRDRDQGLPERGTNRWLSGEARQAGTLQVSRWRFQQRPQGQVYVVVTRQDAGWSTVGDELEPYALCVSIADRSNVQSRLYAHVQAILRARIDQRARARV
ncbi:S8 family peptidase [Zoogloea sp.]|uniref:S8 family peptidase n=1 Tax=Zoogloea sp. TaxID=49181 RepID=UPI0035AED368